LILLFLKKLKYKCFTKHLEKKMIFLSINKEENFEARAEKICEGASEKERNPKKPNFSSSLS